MIRAGGVPGTDGCRFDVKDTLPLHGSVELNNRYSANTPAPAQRLPQLRQPLAARPFPRRQLPDLSAGRQRHQIITALLYRSASRRWIGCRSPCRAPRQNSDVSTLGALDSLGKGEIVGLRANYPACPPSAITFIRFSFGFDYKHLPRSSRAERARPVRTPFGTRPPITSRVTLEYSGTCSAKESSPTWIFRSSSISAASAATPQQFDQYPLRRRPQFHLPARRYLAHAGSAL